MQNVGKICLVNITDEELVVGNKIEKYIQKEFLFFKIKGRFGFENFSLQQDLSQSITIATLACVFAYEDMPLLPRDPLINDIILYLDKYYKITQIRDSPIERQINITCQNLLNIDNINVLAYNNT